MGTTERIETVIIGAGQVGLAAGYHLKKQDRPHVILDAHARVGDPWRKRWPSLKLYSPAKYDELPGLRFPLPPNAFPTTNEMANYLETYAKTFELPVRMGTHVDRLTQEGETFVVHAGDERFEASNVIVSTGVMQVPRVPEFAGELDPRIRQIHSNDYRSPAQLQKGPTLVVGAAHSGADIAWEIAAEQPVILSGRDTGQLPFSVESRRARLAWPLLKFAWTRVLTMSTPMGRKMKEDIRSHGALLLRYRKKDLAKAGVERVFERVAGVEGGKPVLDDGRVLDVANVVWATGFRPDYSWIELPLELEGDYPKQVRGAVESHPGLYFLGMLFLHSFSSMLVLGAGPDARRVVDHLVARESAREKESQRERELAGQAA